MENKMDNEQLRIPKVGDILTGTVIKVTDEEVLVDVGYMFEGTIYKDHLSTKKVQSAKDLFKEGDQIEAKVTKISHGDQTNILLLSRKDLERIEVRQKYREELKIDSDITVKVRKAVKGGLLLDYNSIELFLPDSLVSLENIDEDAKAKLVGTDIEVRIIDIRSERGKEKFIANRKQIQYENLKKQEKAEIAKLEVGETLKGVVSNIADFGAFVKLSDLVEGLIHISELSHYHIKKVDEVLSVGQEVEVKVIKISGKRISLSMKALEERPWDLFLKNHKVGDKVTGKVVKKMQYGMLLEIEREVTGLLSRQDYSWDPEDNLAGRVQPGDAVEVEITSINEDKQQFTLSRKHLEYNPWADLKLRVGEQVSATVKTIVEKGAVLEVSGVEAFLPIREISSEHISRVEDQLKVGDVLTVEVVNFFPREWKMTVSLRKVVEKSQRREYESHLKDNVSANQSLADLFKKFKK
ncbi:MAG: S1 RNA-binding domain-containing protein [Bacilli bacterium]|nr:S1 RNA-binding domain-containing protein [Bacilli bacterium]MBN2696860.1 S1 RNA-binding domain-containing protein [Bacilli bacterium]